MKHEGRCIYPVTCTCVEILRSKLDEAILLIDGVLDQNSRLLIENNSLKKKIEDGLSCCCSGCSRHNLVLQE